MHTPIKPAGAVLASCAMLSTLKVCQWSARKTDKKVTREVNESHNAARDAGRYNKQLLAKSALEKIQTIAGEARKSHYRMTQPWLDDGARILPAKLFIEYSNELRQARERFESAVAEFVANYPSFVEQARLDLNGMFDASDYPDAAKIAAAFDFGTRVYAMPDSSVSSDIRIAIGDQQADDIRKATEAASAEALQGAMRDAWQRIAKVVGAMVERLNAYKPAAGKGERTEGNFHASLVTNIRDLVSVLPCFNLQQLPELDAITARMEQELCAHDADELKDSMQLREATARAAASIMDQVSGYV